VRIDVKRAATRVWHWFGARANDECALRFAAHTIGIRHGEPDLVRRVGLEIENAAGEHVRHNHVDARFAVDAFALEAQQRQRRLPVRLAPLAERHGDGRIAVVVALHEPFEPEIQERRRLDHQLAGHGHVGQRGPTARDDTGPGLGRLRECGCVVSARCAEHHKQDETARAFPRRSCRMVQSEQIVPRMAGAL
jgi:hypothetical protein